jgi:hypothetical protein
MMSEQGRLWSGLRRPNRGEVIQRGRCCRRLLNEMETEQGKEMVRVEMVAGKTTPNDVR